MWFQTYIEEYLVNLDHLDVGLKVRYVVQTTTYSQDLLYLPKHQKKLDLKPLKVLFETTSTGDIQTLTSSQGIHEQKNESTKTYIIKVSDHQDGRDWFMFTHYG